jgi:hypothetical protein
MSLGEGCLSLEEEYEGCVLTRRVVSGRLWASHLVWRGAVRQEKILALMFYRHSSPRFYMIKVTSDTPHFNYTHIPRD